MRILVTLLSLGFLVESGFAHAIDVKGLKLDRPYTPQEVANLFGTASCSDQVKRRAPASIRQPSPTCRVPITYLGIGTDAIIYFTSAWVAKEVRVEVDQGRLDEIEEIFRDRFGAPTIRRGETERMVPAPGGAGLVPFPSRCTVWPNAEGGHYGVCNKPAFVGNSPYIEIKSSARVALDPNDI